MEAFEFGGFRLDRRTRRLIDKSGAPLHVTAKAFDTLVYFLEHPGQVIERSTLLEELWPNTVVEENNLSQAVASLRRLLGDGFIVTVTGRGYQFVGDVRVVTHDPDAEGIAAAPARPRARWPYAAGLVVFALVAAGLVYVYRSMPGEPATGIRPNTLVVLPLVDLSPDQRDEYFADGLTEELINRLARIKTLEVTARTSSFSFKGSNKGVTAIAQALGVRHVLEGSVARSDHRLRVRVQLVDAATGRTVWSESFDRGLQDALAIQEEVAGATAKSLLGPLGLDNVASVGGTRSAEAYELYLAARARSRLTPEDVTRSLERIDRALALDRDFALAWAQKSRLLNRKQVLSGNPTGHAQSAAEQAALRAVSLEPGLGFGHTALAASLMTRRERVQADAEFKKGIALGNWEDAEMYGLFLLSVGHVSRAREHLERVRARDPLNPDLWSWIAATYDSLGDSSTALAELERGRGLFDRWQAGLNIESLARMGTGRREDVRALGALYPDLSFLWQPLAPVFDALDDSDKALAEIRTLFHNPGVFPGHLLALAAMLDRPEFAVEGFVTLTRHHAGAGSSSGILWAHVFRDMRRLPRFREVLQEEGLVAYWRQAGWPDLCRPVGDDIECF
jgi:TolB-like protein/DNA-binding winged helix-turn-helix (wHTH) protein/Flp pilus assembly protein TadD